jgi:hypothetical protein
MHVGFWWESQRKRSTRETRCRWEDNIIINLSEVRWGGVDWIGLAQEDSCGHGNESSISMTC